MEEEEEEEEEEEKSKVKRSFLLNPHCAILNEKLQLWMGWKEEEEREREVGLLLPITGMVRSLYSTLLVVLGVPRKSGI